MTQVQTTMQTILVRSFITACVIGVMLGDSLATYAQQDPPPFHYQELSVNSNPCNGDGSDFYVAFTHTVAAGAAPWIQVHFGEVALGGASFVRITSGKNGDQQTLDARMMQDWNRNSGVFRGSSVTIELVVAPYDTDVSIELVGMTVGEMVQNQIGGVITSLCDGDDDRVPSNDSRVGRLFGGGCTAWLISNGAVLTAGHCFPVSGVVEFNVPLSQSDGTPVPAAIQDQYPIDGVYQASWNDGDGQIGRDWGVFSIGPNSQTGLRAHRVQGFIRCTNALPAVETTLRVTGYGTDSTPPTRNYTEQTDTGPFRGEESDSDGIWLLHRVDTQGANSGSPILWNAQNVAIGIHTNAGCNSDSNSTNSGTSFELNELENFMNQFWGNSVEQVDKSQPALLSPNGSILRPWNSFASGVSALGNGGVLVVVQGSYDETLTINKAMTIQAPVGVVTIGR